MINVSNTSPPARYHLVLVLSTVPISFERLCDWTPYIQVKGINSSSAKTSKIHNLVQTLIKTFLAVPTLVKLFVICLHVGCNN